MIIRWKLRFKYATCGRYISRKTFGTTKPNGQTKLMHHKSPDIDGWCIGQWSDGQPGKMTDGH